MILDNGIPPAETQFKPHKSILERASGYFRIFVHSITDGRVYIRNTYLEAAFQFRIRYWFDTYRCPIYAFRPSFVAVIIRKSYDIYIYNVLFSLMSALQDEFLTFFWQVLQRDIEAHGRIVSSVVKLGDKVYDQQQGEQRQRGQEGGERQEQQEQQQRGEPSQVLRTVKSLERRWHLLFLRALEWQCHIETLVSRVSSKVSFFSFISKLLLWRLFCASCFREYEKDENGASEQINRV